MTANRRWLARLAGLAILSLIGCSGTENVIGEGPVSLFFRNSGTPNVAVTVDWSLDDGSGHSEDFTVYGGYSTELRLPERASYHIDLSAEVTTTSAARAAQAEKPLRVIDATQGTGKSPR